MTSAPADKNATAAKAERLRKEAELIKALKGRESAVVIESKQKEIELLKAIDNEVPEERVGALRRYVAQIDSLQAEAEAAAMAAQAGPQGAGMAPGPTGAPQTITNAAPGPAAAEMPHPLMPQ